MRMVFPSSAGFSCGKDQRRCLTWLDGSRAWVWRKSLFYECTTSACNSPLLKLFYGGLRGRFPWFAPMRLPFTSKTVEHSRYLPAIQAHFVEMHTFSSSRESEFSNSINVCIRPDWEEDNFVLFAFPG